MPLPAKIFKKKIFEQVKAEKEEENKPESLFLKILEEERTIVVKKGFLGLNETDNLTRKGD